MTSIIVKKSDFSGAGKVYDAGPQGLAAIVRGLAIDNARNMVVAASISSITDNTGGTTSTMLTVAGIVAPSGVYNAVSAGGAQTAAFNTSLGKLRSAQASMASTINKVATKLGLPAVSWDEGTNTYNTIPAQDLTGTTANGSTAVNYSSYINAASIAVANLHCLFLAINKVLAALGVRQIPGTFLQNYVSAQTINLAGNNLNMVVIPAVVNDTVSTVPGTNSVKLADATLFLQDMANNYATLAAIWTTMLALTGPAALTDSTGGTASTTEPSPTIVAVDVSPLDGHVDSGGDSASSSALNTLFTAYGNAFSSIQAKLNTYNDYENFPAVPDSSGGTVSGTLASETIAPSAGIGSVAAVGTITEATTTNFVNGDVMTIGNQSFAFVTTLGTTPGQIQVRANTAAGFALTMADVIASMASAVRGLAGISAGVYVPNNAVADTVVASLVPNAAGGATFSATAKVHGTDGNSLVFTNTSSHSELMDGSGVLGGTTSGAAATAASLISIDAAIEVIENNIATLAVQLNDAMVNLGIPPMVDQSGGIPQTGLVAVPATVVTDNLTLPLGVSNAAIITIVTAIRANIATLNAALTAIIGDTVFTAPISVVAG